MKKTPYQRAVEFKHSSTVIRKFGEINVTDGDVDRLTVFFQNYLETYGQINVTCLYPILANFIIFPTDQDLFCRYNDLKQCRTFSHKHFVTLYGEGEGEIRYRTRSVNLSSQISLSGDRAVKKFIKKKCVREHLAGLSLSRQQLESLQEILSSRPYSFFDDLERLVIDIITNESDSDAVSRFNEAIDNHHTSIIYNKARYGVNWYIKYCETRDRNSSLAKTNFTNSIDFWKSRGESDEDACRKSRESQSKRSQLRWDSEKIRTSTRVASYWIGRGFTEEHAKEKVKAMQARPRDFFIKKYGTKEGAYRFSNMVRDRLNTWFSKSQEERDRINRSKARTYSELVLAYGEDRARGIMEKRLSKAIRPSDESIRFFRQLDEILCESLALKSITGYKGSEKRIVCGDNIYFVDYLLGNTIIEYNGSFWHADPRVVSENYIHPARKIPAIDIWYRSCSSCRPWCR